MVDDEHNRTGDGWPKYCARCGDPYREIQRLPGLVNHCPTCFEDTMNGARGE